MARRRHEEVPEHHGPCSLDAAPTGLPLLQGVQHHRDPRQCDQHSRHRGAGLPARPRWAGALAGAGGSCGRWRAEPTVLIPTLQPIPPTPHRHGPACGLRSGRLLRLMQRRTGGALTRSNTCTMRCRCGGLCTKAAGACRSHANLPVGWERQCCSKPLYIIMTASACPSCPRFNTTTPAGPVP